MAESENYKKGTEIRRKLMGEKYADAMNKSVYADPMMQKFGTEMIAPNRENRRVRTQDGRSLRRYVRRWKIERLFAWLFNFRRLVVRYEYHAENFQGFLHLGAAIILLRYL